MLRGDVSGRVPFALVAVLLVMSAGIAAVFAANLGQEDAARRAREAQLSALSEVGDLVHREVQTHAQRIAVNAVGSGMEGALNGSQVSIAFRESFDDYAAQHFPRVVRGVRIDLTDHDARIRLTTRRMMDAVPSKESAFDTYFGGEYRPPRADAPEGWGEVDRVAYFLVGGHVNYTLALEDATVHRTERLRTHAPVPAPFMEERLRQTLRASLGSEDGVGRTVKAILSSLIQFRVLRGWASPLMAGTHARDVLTQDDVALAVNFALLVEEVRRFRTFDEAAAQALDALRGPLGPIPPDLAPAAPDRSVAELLRRFAATGTLDAVDLYALYTGLDAMGLAMNGLLAQALSVMADDILLKHLDYLGVTPSVDWAVSASIAVGEGLDSFWSWLTDQPNRRVRYVHQFVQAILPDTTFFGPVDLPLPSRTYAIPNGSNPIEIEVPAHPFTVPFPTKDLLSQEFYAFWEENYSVLRIHVDGLNTRLRSLVEELAANVARDAVLAGFLPASATGALDPKDNETFLETLARRVEAAVDDAFARLRDDPYSVERLAAGLWEGMLQLLEGFVDALDGAYEALTSKPSSVTVGTDALRNDQMARASSDPDYARLTAAQRDVLRNAVSGDASSWVSGAYAEARVRDRARWDRLWKEANESPLPGLPSLAERLRATVLGTRGLLAFAGDALKALVRESAQAHADASNRAIYPVQFGSFDLWEARDPAHRTSERLRVTHTPSLLRPTTPPSGEWDASSIRQGDLWIDIVDPGEIPLSGDTPNVHYTHPMERSSRPFAAKWTVRVAGNVHLRVETADRVLLGASGLERASLHRPLILDFAASSHIYSGWELAGVSYMNSADLLGDLWNDLLEFLEAAWEHIYPLVRDVLKALIEISRVARQLLDVIVALAAELVEKISEAFSDLADTFYDVAAAMTQGLGVAVDILTDLYWGPRTFMISADGMTFRVALEERAGSELDVRATWEGGYVHIQVLDLEEDPNREPRDGLRYDVVADWRMDAGRFHMTGGIDPIRLVQEMILQGAAWIEDGVFIEFTGLSVETYHVIQVSGGVTVPGPVFGKIEVGLEAIFSKAPEIDLAEMLAESLREALEGESDELSLEGLGDLVVRFASNLLEKVDEILANLVEVSLFVEVEGKLADSVGLGVGLRLVAEGSAVRELFQWVARTILAFLENLFGLHGDADFEALPLSVRALVWVRGEIFVRVGIPEFLENFAPTVEAVGAVLLEANIPTFGRLYGYTWGPSTIRFGVYVEGGVSLRTFGFITIGEAARLWLIQATVRF